jgi:hypothetical protein
MSAKHFIVDPSETRSNPNHNGDLPLFLLHASVDADCRESLVLEQLRQGTTPRDRLDKDDHL